MENDLGNRLQAALNACARMQDQRDTVISERDRAVRALTRAGFTDHAGQEWKPPLGLSASPLLDRIDQLSALLREARESTYSAFVEAACRHDIDGCEHQESLRARIDAALAGKLPEQHPDDAAVDRFAIAMKAKLASAREKGRGGWDDPSACSVDFLAELLVGHVGKGNHGNFEDIANLAMMLHQRGSDPAVLAGKLPVVPEGWQLAPFNPTEEQWDGLARAIVFWMRSYPSNQHTPRTLVEFITSYGHAVPKWMEEESELLAKDHVISKGTIAVLIYKAMLAAAPKPEGGA